MYALADSSTKSTYDDDDDDDDDDTTTTTTIIIIIIVEVFDSGGEGLGGWSPTALWRSGFDPRPVYAR